MVACQAEVTDHFQPCVFIRKPIAVGLVVEVFTAANHVDEPCWQAEKSGGRHRAEVGCMIVVGAFSVAERVGYKLQISR
jgi:hypothetical protein